jgi:hypothetical protein
MDFLLLLVAKLGSVDLGRFELDKLELIVRLSF